MAGGFLLAQNTNNTQAATTYTQIFADDFTRDGGTTPMGGLGNGWVDTDNQYRGSGGTTFMAGATAWINPLLRPTSEAVQNGKVTAGTGSAGALQYALVARYNTTAGYYYSAYFQPSSGTIGIGKIPIGQEPDSSSLTTAEATFPSGSWRAEFEVNSIDDTAANLELNIYKVSTNALVATLTTTDTDAAMQTAGQWGVQYANSAYGDNFFLYQIGEPANFTFTPNVENVKVGTPVAFSIRGPAQTVTLSDNGAGGTFSSNSVTLATSNMFMTTVTYTPAKLGPITVTATPSVSNVETSQITVSPFNLKIGFIGDSLTFGSHASTPATTGAVAQQIVNLGSDYSFINLGVSGATTQTWVDTQLAPALTAFQSGNVETVQILLGGNDSKRTNAIPSATYKANLENIIGQLKNIGIKRIILNEPPTGWPDDATSDSLLPEYKQVLRELVDGEVVFLGDTVADDYFNSNPSSLDDGTHPNDTGYAKLGQLWADAYNRLIIQPLEIDHEFAGANGNTYVQGSATGIRYIINKDLGWFDVGTGNFANVLVDDAIVGQNNYTVASGSTEITLAASYLDTLAAGPHNLTVRFSDGISFSGMFNILAESEDANPVDPMDLNVPGTPNTGLFGSSVELTMAALSVLAIIATCSAVLAGRKLIED